MKNRCPNRFLNTITRAIKKTAINIGIAVTTAMLSENDQPAVNAEINIPKKHNIKAEDKSERPTKGLHLSQYPLFKVNDSTPIS